MAKYLITGGRQRYNASNIKEWHGYDKAISIIFDSDNLESEVFFEYTSPREHVADHSEPSITFKACSIHSGFLYATTQTEILKISINERKLVDTISLPVFNDLHHVFVNQKGNYVVTSTGLDAVFEVSPEGKIEGEWSTTEQSIWSKFDSETDYRKVISTKPHVAHPNHCVEINGEYWVTRCHNKDILNLQSRETIEVTLGPPHDGLKIGNHLYFTHVNSIVSKLNIETKKVSKILDMNELNKKKESLGWCRGITLLNQHEFIVGFTRVRPTTYEGMIEWAKRKFTNKASYYGSLPSRIVKYNVMDRIVEWEYNLESVDINAVFSILPIED